ncbi:MAG: hypothetical protein MUO70_05070, partial [Euryarchaeota archaeon]|nr:hypothetical protein [Euryarchaeota archaeon]
MDDAFIKINTALLDKVSRPFPSHDRLGAPGAADLPEKFGDHAALVKLAEFGVDEEFDYGASIR